MGLMAIVETLFSDDQSRRDFLFARRRSRGGRPPRREPTQPAPLDQPPEGSWFGKKVSRRTVVGAGSLLGGLGVGAFVADRLGLLKLFPPLPEQSEPVVEYPEVKLYYPELKDYEILANGKFSTDKTITRWLNFSSAQFNSEIAVEAVKFFESLTKTERQIDYKFGNQSIPFFLGSRPRAERVIFLVPQQAPVPSWPDVTANASTTGIFEGGPYVTFVRMHNAEKKLPPSLVFITIDSAASKAFAVEACQSSVGVLSLSPEIAHLGQEIVCNSYGAAFTLKQLSMPYDQYETWAKSVLITKDPQSPSYPIYVLLEKEYSAIPNVGMVISKN